MIYRNSDLERRSSEDKEWKQMHTFCCMPLYASGEQQTCCKLFDVLCDFHWFNSHPPFAASRCLWFLVLQQRLGDGFHSADLVGPLPWVTDHVDQRQRSLQRFPVVWPLDSFVRRLHFYRLEGKVQHLWRRRRNLEPWSGARKHHIYVQFRVGVTGGLEANLLRSCALYIFFLDKSCQTRIN